MIFNLYSKRKKELLKSDGIYIYDEIPERLRIQIYYIVDDLAVKKGIFTATKNILLEEYGQEKLISSYCVNDEVECKTFLKTVKEVDGFLDFIEVAFYLINVEVRELFTETREYVIKLKGKGNEIIDNKIEELNHRFKENDFGYQFIENQIIRIDKELIHSEVIKPTLNLLYEEEFESANEEFLLAFKFYKEGCSDENPNENYKNAIINCNKAFESTMKIICERKRNLVKNYDKKHEARKLIGDLLDAGILPRHLENSFHGVRSILKGIKDSLENGIPVLRNKVGHGKGNEDEWIDEEFVTYAINMTASNMILLVELYKKL